jgi:hypothetical protein
MLTLATASTIGGVAGTVSAVTYSIFGMTLASGTETYLMLAQGQLATSAGALYTVPGSTSAFIKQIILANTTSSIVSGVILYVNGTSAGNQITGSILIPANGTVMLDDDGLAVYDGNGSLQSAISNQTATNLTGTPNLPNGTTATTQAALDDSTKLSTTAYTDNAVLAYSTLVRTIYTTTVNLGTQPATNGNFLITGLSGLTTGKIVFVEQAGQRANSTQTDSVEWDQIQATGIVLNSTTIQINWGCMTVVANSWTFNYWIGQ